jgi:hypothetical protein
MKKPPRTGPHQVVTESGESMIPSTERRIRYLAALDWKGLPAQLVRAMVGKLDDSEADPVSSVTISDYRASSIYKVALEEQRQEWKEQMLRLPQSAELRKKIGHAMSLSIEAVIEILCIGKDADRLSAARLASQWDGRFLHGEDGEGKERQDVDTVAQELLNALKRHTETVQ